MSSDRVQERFDRWVGFLAGAAIGGVFGCFWTMGRWSYEPWSCTAILVLTVVGFGIASAWLRGEFWDAVLNWRWWRW